MSGSGFPVAVEGNWTRAETKSVKNKLQIYFQSNKKSSGGECQVEVEESSLRAKIIFSSEEVRVRVLARENHEITVGKRTIKLHLSSAPCQIPQNSTSGSEDPTSLNPESQIPARENPKIQIPVSSQPQNPTLQNPTSQDETATQATAASVEVEIVGMVLDNISESMTRELLTLLVENISGLEAGEYNLEIIFEVNKAVVTFNNMCDALSFISKGERGKRLEKRGLTAWPLEATKSIRVENLLPSTSQDMLELFFDKVLACPENITLIPDEKAALLTFSDSKVLRNINQDYTIASTPVKVYPHYQSLGTALYGKDRPTWKMPEPVTEKVHHVIYKFLVKKNLVNTINTQMRPYYCSVDMDQAEVTLRPLPNFLRQNGVTAKQVDDWKSNALSAFRQHMAEYSAFQCPVNEAAWKESQKTVHSILKEDGLPVIDTSSGVLTIAGHADSMKRIRDNVEDVIKKSMSHIERKTSGIKETVDLPPATFYTVMASGLQKRIMDTYPELQLTYCDDKHKLSIAGLPTEVYQTKSWIFEMIPNISRKPLNLPPRIFEFLTTIDIDDLSRDLFISHEIRAFLSVENKQAILIGACGKSIQDAESKMKSDLDHRKLDVEDAEVLNLQSWKDINKELLETYNSPKKKTVSILPLDRKDTLAVAGFRSPVNEVSNHLQKFLLNHARVQETLRVKSGAVVHFIEKQKLTTWASLCKDSGVIVKFKSEQRRIHLEGFRLNVQSVKSKLQELAEGLFCDSLVLDKPGAKKYCQKSANMFLPSLSLEFKCAIMLQPDNQEEEEEEATHFSEGKIVFFCKVKTTDGVLVSVGKADICSLNVDVIVNAANEELKHIGGLAYSILRAAGPKMQDICDDYISKNGKLQPGDAITTDPCNLPCKHVVHAVGPRFSRTDRKTFVSCLKCAVKESLKQAEKNNSKTIALPAISSGMFSGPLDLCAQTIAEAVREYCDRAGGPMSLEEIHLVDNTDNTVKALVEAVNSEFSDLKPVMSLPLEEGRSGAGSNRDRQYGGRGERRNQQPQHSKVNENQRGARRKQPSSEHLNTKERGRGAARPGSSGNFKWGQMPKLGGRKPTNDGGLNIVLHEGNIQEQTTAVIVNTIDKNLNLSQGAVSRAILTAAGPSLQQTILTNVGKASPQFGDVIITDGFNLQCQKVFHAICPHWEEGNGVAEKKLKSIIQYCLEEAERRELPSISFPAIGTGNLRFPRRVVSGILQQKIQDFIKTREYRHVKEVVIVVHPSDQETVKCFRSEFKGQRNRMSVEEEEEEEEEEEAVLDRASVDPSQAQQPTDSFGQVSCPSLGVYKMQMGPLTLEVSSGDITKEATDAIVNTSNDTFDLKTGVSKAILEAAGSAVEQECQTTVASPSYQGSHMILTSAGLLPSKCIIHVVGKNKVDEIKEIVYKVLKVCEENQFRSVSFPALGTGQGGAHPFAVAEAMIDAVVDFVRKKATPHVQEVKILIFQAEMSVEFLKCMKKKEGEPVAEKSFFAKGLDAVKGTFSSLTSMFKSDEDSTGTSRMVVEREEFEPAVFLLCADNTKTLTLVKKKIEALIVDEQAEKTISDWFISQLAEEDVMQLEALQREMTVRIHLDKGTEEQEPHILLEGLTRDVASAESAIRELLRKVERKDNLRSKAKLMADLVEWKYEHGTGAMQVFDMFTNLELEEARKSQKKVRVKINGSEYEADAVKNEAVSIRGQKTMELFRRDLREEPDLPSKWSDMNDDRVKQFPLTPEDQEYKDMLNKLKAEGFTGNITTIERVQNRTLWQSYQLLKKDMELKNKHQNNEMILYHGTKSDSIAHINKHGFNRGYAGMHGAVYGNGSYFAVNPMYSYNYAKPDSNNNRHMYVARVLVGDFVKGVKGMITPPTRNTGQAADLYDSVVDLDPNPTIHVIFNDIQAYPEYLVTFT